MKFKDLISMALKNLKNRKMRTFLTVLGVVIGATSIIIMLSVGFGYKRINKEMYNSLGDLNTLEIRPDQPFYNDSMSAMAPTNEKEKNLNQGALEEIKKVNHVEVVMPIYSGSASLKSGRYSNEWVDIIATDPNVLETFGYNLSDGRFLNNSDKNAGVILSFNASKNFRDPKRSMVDTSDKVKPMKSKIDIYDVALRDNHDMDSFQSLDEKKVYTEKLKVVGILEDNPNNWEESNAIIMSIDYFKSLIKATNDLNKKKTKFPDFSLIKVRIDDFENTKAVQEELKSLGYNATNSFADFWEQENKTLSIIQIVFGAIGSISFIVAAIGITNTMIMSIYERTKEIGVMKVIGAQVKDIQKLFLVESGFIGLFGGIIGVILSYGLSFLFNYLSKNFINGLFGGMGASSNISYIPIWLSLIALIFSSGVGVLSGYLPARRAMNLSALDAIRSE